MTGAKIRYRISFIYEFSMIKNNRNMRSRIVITRMSPMIIPGRIRDNTPEIMIPSAPFTSSGRSPIPKPKMLKSRGASRKLTKLSMLRFAISGVKNLIK
jgi:hypothetical protein